MDGDQGALNKFEHGEWSAGLNDLLVSAKALAGRVETDAEKAAALAIHTFISQFAKPLGAQALQLGTTVVADAASGQSVTEIAAAVTPQIAKDLISDAETAGTNTEQVVLDAARVALSSATPNAVVPSDASGTAQASPDNVG